jgi:twinkle protein
MSWSHGVAITAELLEESRRMARITQEHANMLRNKRNLDPDLCERLGVRSVGKSIGFDYRKDGQLWNTKIRHGKGNMPWELTGRKPILWNLDCLAAAPDGCREPLIFVEGEPDGVACIQAGFRYVVSVPCGAPDKPAKIPDALTAAADNGFAYLYENGGLLRDLSKFSVIILAVDGDKAGRNLRDALAFRLNDERCRHVQWPEGSKDANDVLMAEDENFLRNVILDARPMWNDEVCKLSDIPEDDDTQGLTTGWPELDNNLRLKLGHFMTIVGPYRSGKSVFLRQLAVNLYREHGWKIFLTSFEEKVKPLYRRDLRRHILGRPTEQHLPEDEVRADIEIESGFTFLRKKRGVPLNMIRMLDRIEFAIKVYGVNVVMIDPIDSANHDKGSNESDYWRGVIQRCTDLAHDYNVLFIVCTHPSKAGTDRLAKGGEITTNDGHGTANWGSMSDYGLCMWQPSGGGNTILYLDKNKDNETMGFDKVFVELVHDSSMNSFSIGRIGKDLMNIINAERDGLVSGSSETGGSGKYNNSKFKEGFNK